MIAVFTTAGSLVSTFAGPGTKPYCCGGYSSFYVGDADTHIIYENGVPVVTGIQTPTGLDVLATTKGPYEAFLAVADGATNRINIYVNNTPAVIPGSLGRVKAVYK